MTNKNQNIIFELLRVLKDILDRYGTTFRLGLWNIVWCCKGKSLIEREAEIDLGSWVSEYKENVKYRFDTSLVLL
jgi:hypothetical protein